MKNFNFFAVILGLILVIFTSSCKKECLHEKKQPKQNCNCWIPSDTVPTQIKTDFTWISVVGDQVGFKVNPTTGDTTWYTPSNPNGCWAGYSEPPYGFSDATILVVRFWGEDKLHRVFTGPNGEIMRDQNGDFAYDLGEYTGGSAYSQNPTAVKANLLDEMNNTWLNFAVWGQQPSGGTAVIYTKNFLCR